MEELWKNKKNGMSYLVVDEVINCTNDVDGQRMFLYRPQNKNLLYVREKSEFYEKFEKVENKKFPEPAMTDGVDPLTMFRHLASGQHEGE